MEGKPDHARLKNGHGTWLLQDKDVAQPEGVQLHGGGDRKATGDIGRNGERAYERKYQPTMKQITKAVKAAQKEVPSEALGMRVREARRLWAFFHEKALSSASEEEHTLMIRAKHLVIVDEWNRILKDGVLDRLHDHKWASSRKPF